MFRSKVKPFYLSAAVLLAVVLTWQAGIFKGLEFFAEDLLLFPIGISSDIVIVTIDDASIAKIGQWPWPREEYAKLIEALKNNPPKVLAFDVLLSEPSRVGSWDDVRFARALAAANFPIVLVKEGEIEPVSIFKTAGREIKTGDVHLLVDPDGIVRRAQVGGSLAGELLNVGNSRGIERIAYGGGPGTVRRLSFSKVLEDSATRQEINGKIVLVGATATDLHDEQLTPLARGVAMPGVEIQANIANMLIRNQTLHDFSGTESFLIILIATLLPAVCFALFSGFWTPIVASVFVGLVGLLAVILFHSSWLLAPVIYPALAWLLSSITQLAYRYFGTERSRREIQGLFGKYVSRDVLEELLRNPSQVKLGGEEREVTILFSDIRGFTAISEKMSPGDLTRFLNRYLTRMTDIILREGGVVDKYIGDAIMAFWGAPVVNTQHTFQAIKAATAMQDSLYHFNQENIKLGLLTIEIGVGVNSGPVVVGNMGSDQRFDYTVMGDAVNLASRLEGLTKYYHAPILVSAATLAGVGEENLKNVGIVWRELDQVRVKGKQEAVRIFEVAQGERAALLRKIKPDFDAARESYYRGYWEKCLERLALVEKVIPDDGPSAVLRARCHEFLSSPPPAWSGIYDHQSK